MKTRPAGERNVSKPAREPFKIRAAFVEHCRHSLVMLIQQKHLPDVMQLDAWDWTFGISEVSGKDSVCRVHAAVSRMRGYKPVRWEAYVDMQEVPRFISPLSAAVQWCAESLSRQLVESGAYRDAVRLLAQEKPATPADKVEPT